jgi:hypothetical protein
MFSAFMTPYGGYIDAAKDDGNSSPCTCSASLKGIYHGYQLCDYDENGAQGSAGPRLSSDSGEAS